MQETQCSVWMGLDAPKYPSLPHIVPPAHSLRLPPYTCDLASLNTSVRLMLGGYVVRWVTAAWEGGWGMCLTDKPLRGVDACYRSSGHRLPTQTRQALIDLVALHFHISSCPSHCSTSGQVKMAAATTSRAAWMAILLATILIPQAVLGMCADAEQTLKLHNEYRAKHSAPPLRWDARAAARAQVWAKRLAGAGCRLQHSPWGFRSPCGENLYALFGLADLGLCQAATRMWYEEKKLYRFTSRPWSSNRAQFAKIGHFSQVVWRATVAVGCAAATGPRCTAVTCHYVTSGNMVTDQAFADNVKGAREA